ncbi:MAG: hypothetical protein ACREBU_23010 [Nitrososphaera sp.]
MPQHTLADLLRAEVEAHRETLYRLAADDRTGQARDIVNTILKEYDEET